MVALSAGEQSGSDIQSQIVGDTVGLYVRASSIYTALDRLEEMGLVESAQKTAQKKSYKLTEEGWRQLALETHTLDSLVRNAKQRIVTSGHGRW
jgi:DNA-binding PadR family transcriptional regulator